LPLLDRELSLLPGKYRAAIVLCDLEGRTRKDAARLLKVPEGTLSSRLASGRHMLAKRLARRCGPAGWGAGGACEFHGEGRGAGRGRSDGGGHPGRPAHERGDEGMLLKKLRLGVGAVMAVLALGAVGFGHQVSDGSGARRVAPEPRRLGGARQGPALVALRGRADGDVTLESVPPVVVKTVPAAGSDDVDPKLTEIKVTFSKDMEDGSWSWVTVSGDSFPKVDGKPKYLADMRTCVLPVKLEAGKTYAVWVNSEKFENFQDKDGKPAVPYLLVFKTKK
jgi:RNA polymerase sigma-70 factor (ECF subfamily)